MKKGVFIAHILENRKLSISQKEKFLNLIAKELPDLEQNDKVLISKIEGLESRLNALEENKTEYNKEFSSKPSTLKNPFSSLNLGEMSKLSHNNYENKDHNNLPKYYYPVSLYKFLFFYNQNEVLKSTCHDIDSDELEIITNYCEDEKYNFENHLDKIIQAYNSHEEKYFAPSNVKSLIRVYITGKNYKGQVGHKWSSDGIQIGWSSLKLKKWSEKNPNYPPNPSEGLIETNEKLGFEFEPFQSKLTGQYIQSFGELVIHFKHLFHIRSDNSLRSIIKRKNKAKGWNENITFIMNEEGFPENVEHFTDIDKLIQSYTKIIELILEVVKKNKQEKAIVELRFMVDLEKCKFSIHHINSTYGKTIFNTLERLGQTYKKLILNQINGLCEMHLRADFGKNQLAEINLWDGNKRRSKAINQKGFGGVEHLFVFPKK